MTVLETSLIPPKAADQETKRPLELESPLVFKGVWEIVDKVKEERRYRAAIRDEFQPDYCRQEIKPLREVVNTQGASPTDFTSEIQAQFDQLALTMDLEVDSKKASILTKVAQQLADLADIGSVSVVIMNRGEDPNAFVYPDGSIFLSQSLLNLLDSMDEIAAVLAHEVSHLANRTFETKQSSGLLIKFGVGWAHEMAADLSASNLLGRAGYNSVAFSSAIKKIAGSFRGFEHQSGLSRASELIAAHFFVDTETSHQSFQAKPVELEQEHEPTNLEIAQYAIRERNFGLLEEVLPLLCPDDFSSIFDEIDFSTLKIPGFFRRVIKLYDDIIRRRLQSQFDSDEIDFALISKANPPGKITSAYIIKTFEQLLTIVEAIPNLVANNRIDQMSEVLQGSGHLSSGFKSLINFMSVLETDLFKKSAFERVGLKIDQFQLVQLIDGLLSARNQLSQTQIDEKSQFKDQKINAGITRLLLSYIEKYYISVHGEEAAVQVDKIRELLDKLHSLDIVVDENTLRHDYKPFDYRVVEAWPRVIEIFEEGFSEKNEVEVGEPNQIVSDFFDGLLQDYNSKQRYNSVFLSEKFRTFSAGLLVSLDVHDCSTEERLEIIDQIKERVRDLPYKIEVDLFKVLGSGFTDRRFPGSDYFLIDEKDEQVHALNQRLFHLALEINFALSFFSSDSDEFYNYLEESFARIDLDWSQCNQLQLLNILQSFYPSENKKIFGFFSEVGVSEYPVYGSSLTITDYERLYNLDPFKQLLEFMQELTFDSLAQLKQHIKGKFQKVIHVGQGFHILGQTAKRRINMFSDDSFHLVAWQSERRALLSMIEEGVAVEDIPDLIDLMHIFFPSDNQRRLSIYQMALSYLESSEIGLEARINFLTANLNLVGPQGAEIIAKQISSIDQYEVLRDQVGVSSLNSLLQGSAELSMAAAADVASAYFASDFKTLFATGLTTQEEKEEQTNGLAKRWIRRTFISSQDIIYDEKRNKFNLSQIGRSSFISFADLIQRLRHLRSFERAGLVHKALTDQGGALTSKINREKLAELASATFHLESGFAKIALESAIRVGKADIVSFPASIMLARSLFQSLDLDALNPDKLLESVSVFHDDDDKKIGKKVTAEELERILTSSTRELVVFGRDFAHQPNSAIAQLAQQSDIEYQRAYRSLTAQFAKKEEEPLETEVELDQDIESILSALEAGGASTVRQLQLATQFYQFEPVVHRRISRCLDSNPGMSHLSAWENLYLWSTPRDEDVSERKREKLQLRKFLETVSLGEKIGGGSLNSIFLLTEKETGRQLVLRLQNPNAAFFIESGHELVEQTYNRIQRSSRGRYRREVKIGKMLNDLSRDWCLRDISDETFEEDDPFFRRVIIAADQKSPVKYCAPELVFTQEKIKVEELAAGMTANQFMRSEVDYSQKRTLAATIAQFFEHQLEFEQHKIVAEDGSEFIFVHSDQHLGNYMVNFTEGGLELAIIDRNMYLKLMRADVEVIKALIDPSRKKEFVQLLLDRVLSLNNVDGVEAEYISGLVKARLLPELVKQVFLGGIDEFSLLQKIFETFASQGLSIPLNLQLMIRNAAAYRELKAEFEI